MINIDGVWTMEGLDRKDPKRIKTHMELGEYIKEVGFLPLFKNEIPGFSVEEITASDGWWSGVPQEDPWEWRQIIAEEGEIAYAKLFSNKAGFVSKEWYPYLASYRRNGYDFDSRYEDGLASYKAKRIMDVLMQYEVMPSNNLKIAAGFDKGGEKGFDGVITLLQMQTYITIRSFHKRVNKKNEEYGWSVADYTLSENLFTPAYVRSGYHMSALEAKDKIVTHLKSTYPTASIKGIEKIIK